jgi:hypothetical protein
LILCVKFKLPHAYTLTVISATCSMLREKLVIAGHRQNMQYNNTVICYSVTIVKYDNSNVVLR